MRPILIAVSAVVMFSSGAIAQDCARQMEQNMSRMMDNAVQCGESASLMATFGSGRDGGIGLDELASMCQQGISVDSQLNAFNECSRTYVCAVLAYGYALENLAEYGGDCAAAAAAGLQYFPVQ